MLGYQPKVGKLSTLFQPQLLLSRRLVVEGKMGAGVKSSCYLFEGMLYLGLRLSVG